MSKQGLEEYDTNQYICALPDLQPFGEVVEQLAVDFHFDESERNYEPHLRLHAVMRLSRFFSPLSQHLALQSSIMLALRQGYIGRQPNTPGYEACRKASLARINKDEAHQDRREQSKACSFAFLGCSGTGKSYSVRRILKSIDQVIVHVEPATIFQVVWLLVECPHKGNLRGLCLRILGALDDALGTTTYRTDYGSGRHTVEEMLVNIQQLFTIHAVGILIIDEIQNLREARQPDKSAIQKFFVLLVNSVGVPVIPVGTLGAASVFDSVFSDARRASGLGSIIWYPLPRGSDANDEWPDFVRQLWRGQWTVNPTPLTHEILEALYEETQGVLDLVVILYMLCQLQLIQLTAIKSIDGSTFELDETITTDLIRSVALEKFQLVRPLLNALRSGDASALADFDDLLEFHESLETERQGLMSLPATRRIAPTGIKSRESLNLDDAHKILATLGVASDICEVIVAELSKLGQLNVPTLVSRASSVLTPESPGLEKSKPATNRKRKAQANKLLECVKLSREEGLSIHNGFELRQYCKPLAEDFPW